MGQVFIAFKLFTINQINFRQIFFRSSIYQGDYFRICIPAVPYIDNAIDNILPLFICLILKYHFV